MNVEKPTLNALIISRLEDMGRLREKVTDILHNSPFNNLSKHNPYWDSEHEIEADKLEEIRLQLSVIEDRLCDLMDILNKDWEA